MNVIALLFFLSGVLVVSRLFNLVATVVTSVALGICGLLAIISPDFRQLFIG